MRTQPTDSLPRGFARVEHRPSGHVYLRHLADAREMSTTNPETFALVRDGRPSINEVLTRLSVAQLVEHARSHGVPAFHATNHADLVIQLASQVENGTLPLPTPETNT